MSFVSSLRLAQRLLWAPTCVVPVQPGALRACAACSTTGGTLAPLLPPPPAAAGARHASSSRPGAASSSRPHRRRSVAAAAGRRGNVFLGESTEPKKGRGGSSDDEVPASKLFDSSRFNYDSDEDEDGFRADEAAEQQEVEQHPQRRRRQGGAAAAAAAGQQQGDGEVVEVVLPAPRGVRVKTAEFIKSSVNVEQCPPARFPEFAVIGRSNVGKSSLINLLTGRNSLAMVSKTPGKTRCINHFFINGAWYLVDLPGYGYAKAGKSNVIEWNTFTRQYFLERETLVTVLLLVDASIPPMKLDLACVAWFAEAEIPFTLVFTKLDKRKKGGTPADENIAAFEAACQEACGYVPPVLLTSSKSGMGKNELLAHVAQLRDFFNKTHHGM